MVLGRFRLLGLVSSLAALPGCGAEDGHESEMGVVASALTLQDVLGFESTQGWSPSAGTVATTSVHSQGSAALSVSASGYTELTSAPLSTLSDVSSRGLYSAYVGQASVQGLPANAFSRLDLAVPAQVQQVLSGSYSDLRFK